MAAGLAPMRIHGSTTSTKADSFRRFEVIRMRIIGATLTPFEDTFRGTPFFGYYSEAKEAKRQAINAWIRTSGAFDGVIDFDAATRDPANPKHIRAEFDSGDHLHPNDAGYEAMADTIDLGHLGVKR